MRILKPIYQLLLKIRFNYYCYTLVHKEILLSIKDHINQDTILTDTGSVKEVNKFKDLI